MVQERKVRSKSRGKLPGRREIPAVGVPMAPLDPSVALGVTTQAAVATTETLAGLAGAPAAAAAAADAGESNLLDALPSKAYGDFVREIGLAVADGQKALDENSVNAALKLAETQIPALIALNQIVNEDGEVEEVKPVVQNDARLIQYIQPTFYEWSRVTLFARFEVKEFKANASTEITAALSTRSRGGGISGGLGFGRGGFSGSLGGSFGGSNTSVSSTTEIDSSLETESASGTSFIVAELRPRRDTRFPPPIIAVQGPRLTLTSTATTLPKPIDASSPSTTSITVVLFKKDGFRSITGKTVDFVLDGPGLLSTSSVVLTEVTGDDKRLSATLSLTRRSADTPGTATVRGSIGTLNASVAIAFPAPAPP